MTNNEARLLELLKERSFRRGEFRLASGATSDYFIDGKMTAAHSEGAFLIGEVVRSEERRVGKECRSRWSPYH